MKSPKKAYFYVKMLLIAVAIIASATFLVGLVIVSIDNWTYKFVSLFLILILFSNIISKAILYLINSHENI